MAKNKKRKTETGPKLLSIKPKTALSFRADRNGMCNVPEMVALRLISFGLAEMNMGAR